LAPDGDGKAIIQNRWGADVVGAERVDRLADRGPRTQPRRHTPAERPWCRADDERVTIGRGFEAATSNLRSRWTPHRHGHGRAASHRRRVVDDLRVQQEVRLHADYIDEQLR